jgi:hypothetical protein
MKSVIICYNCDQLTRFSETYKVKITDYKPSFVQEEKKPETKKYVGINEEVTKARICRKCARKAGYKVKTKHKKIKLGITMKEATKNYKDNVE